MSSAFETLCIGQLDLSTGEFGAGEGYEPVLAVAVAGEEAEAREHAGEIFRTWRAHLESMFLDSGLSQARARALAALTITSAEGAVAVARAEQDLETLELVARQVIALART